MPFKNFEVTHLVQKRNSIECFVPIGSFIPVGDQVDRWQQKEDEFQIGIHIKEAYKKTGRKKDTFMVELNY